jgi:TorA maturation chaperone TorD
MEHIGNMANDFIRNHQVNWIPGFTEDLENATESPLYLALALTTRKFVTSLPD